MSDNSCVYLRKTKRSGRSSEMMWVTIRSHPDSIAYVHLDTAAERIYDHFFGESDTEVPQDLLANIRAILRGEDQ